MFFMDYEFVKDTLIGMEYRGKIIGLEIEDYDKLKSIYNSITYMKLEDSKWKELNNRVLDIMCELRKKGITYAIDEYSTHYVKDNSFLLPLVLANNSDDRIKMISDNSYTFMCQFCNTSIKPRMSVTDYLNRLYCFDCRTALNVISYIENVEKITYLETICLLAAIYNIDIERRTQKIDSCYKHYKNSRLCEKYKKIILSEKYRDLLEMGEDRLRRKDQNRDIDIDIDKMYKERYETIKRIQNDEVDKKYNHEKAKKLIKLD